MRYRTTAPAVERPRAKSRGFLLLVLTALLAACSHQNAHERLADDITRAVVANDVSPVMNRLDPGIEGELTRVRIAELSDQLNAQGAYQGLHQTSGAWCPQGALCFDVQFEKAPFHEIMKLAEDGKVKYWWIRAARPSGSEQS